jgi:dephospho-CoA kinase
MLRVGLTGGLGSGKSTVAAIFAKLGAHVLHADEIGRELMQPGQPAYVALLQHFGPGVLVGAPGSELDRRELARIAFGEGRVEELNALVHPLVIRRQAEAAESIAQQEPEAVVVVESALIFETKYGEPSQSGEQPWRARFDRLVLVTAPEAEKIARFVRRATESGDQRSTDELAAEARRRLAAQMPDSQKIGACDFVISNDRDLPALQAAARAVWSRLDQEAREARA